MACLLSALGVLDVLEIPRVHRFSHCGLEQEMEQVRFVSGEYSNVTMIIVCVCVCVCGADSRAESLTGGMHGGLLATSR